MGALSGTLTTTAFYIEGDLPDDFRDRYVAALNHEAFKDIDLNLDKDESLGWVTAQSPFDAEFDLNKVLWGDYMMFALRNDVIRLPATAFKLHLERRLEEYRDQTGRERLGKAEREEVAEVLKRELRKRVLPSIKTHDVVWNIERKVAWLFTTNKRVIETFIDMFHDTFGLQAHERNPYSLIEHMGLTDQQMELLLQIEPAAFAAPPTATAGR